MSIFKNIRTAFKFKELFGALITGFSGSNIVTAVLYIAIEIRQWFADGRPSDQVDDLALAVYDNAPQGLKDRYDAKGYFKEAVLRFIEGMHLLHLGKEHIKAHQD
jgi:hypothetical protein